MSLMRFQSLIIIILIIFLSVGFLLLFFNKREQKPQSFPLKFPLNMKIKSSAFEPNQFIPAKYTCDGANINPPLYFEEIPAEAKSLVLIMEDPDAPAGNWVHWVLWNIKPQITQILENEVPPGSIQGKTSFGKVNYGGPCPPFGTHRYFFRLFALDKELELKTGADIKELQKAMENHILDKAELVGLYGRFKD
jgi:Raf kinase inhibitor-like YbhB/YbcL family protein